MMRPSAMPAALPDGTGRLYSAVAWFTAPTGHLLTVPMPASASRCCLTCRRSDGWPARLGRRSPSERLLSDVVGLSLWCCWCLGSDL